MIFKKFLSQRTVIPYSATPPKPAMTRSSRPSTRLATSRIGRNAWRLPSGITPERSAGSGSIFKPSIAATKWPSFIRWWDSVKPAGPRPTTSTLCPVTRSRQRPPDVERVPAGQQRIDFETPGQPEHVLQRAGLDLRNVDRVLPLIDAGLHAVVADAVPGRRTERVVDGDDGEGAEAVAARLHQVHLGDLLLERAAREGDAKDRLLERAVLLAQPLRAAVLALVVAPDAVIRLVERAGQVGSGIGQRKALRDGAIPPRGAAASSHHPVRRFRPGRDVPCRADAAA